MSQCQSGGQKIQSWWVCTGVSALEISRFHWEVMSELSKSWAVQVLQAVVCREVRDHRGCTALLGSWESIWAARLQHSARTTLPAVMSLKPGWECPPALCCTPLSCIHTSPRSLGVVKSLCLDRAQVPLHLVCLFSPLAKCRKAASGRIVCAAWHQVRAPVHHRELQTFQQLPEQCKVAGRERGILVHGCMHCSVKKLEQEQHWTQEWAGQPLWGVRDHALYELGIKFWKRYRQRLL